MYDIKLYAKCERDIDSVIHITRIYRTDIDIVLKGLNDQNYGIMERCARKSASAKYLHRVRQVLRSQLNGQNKIRVIKKCALPIIR